MKKIDGGGGESMVTRARHARVYRLRWCCPSPRQHDRRRRPYRTGPTGPNGPCEGWAATSASNHPPTPARLARCRESAPPQATIVTPARCRRRPRPREVLSDGRVRATEVKRRCLEVGISLRTLDNAKLIVGVPAQRCEIGRRAEWWWRNRPPPSTTAQAEAFVRELRGLRCYG
jgi:hypothetical protein